MGKLDTTGHRRHGRTREKQETGSRDSQSCRLKAARAKAAAARHVASKAKKQDSRHDGMTGDALKLAKEHRPGMDDVP